MLPLNYATLKLFEDGNEYDVQGVMSKLKDEYGRFRSFKPSVVNESLMAAEKNGFLDPIKYELDDKKELHVYYKANDYGIDMIKQYIK